MKDLSQYDCFVFAGGGPKGPAYIGAWQAFLNYPHRCTNVSAVAGSSVGALMACAIACCLTCTELTELQHRIVEHTQEISTRLLNPVGGIFDNDVLQNLVGEVLSKRHRTDISLSQLYAVTGIRLVVTVTCVESGSVEYWDHEVEPNAPVATAVAASMCIPVIFAPIVYRNCRYVDGGIKCNFPFDIFPKHRTLGFRFASSCNPTRPGLKGYAMQLLKMFESTIGETRCEFAYQCDKQIISITVPQELDSSVDLQSLTVKSCVVLGAQGQLSFLLFAIWEDLYNVLVFYTQCRRRLENR